jgi:hypothetical protein
VAATPDQHRVRRAAIPRERVVVPPMVRTRTPRRRPQLPPVALAVLALVAAAVAGALAGALTRDEPEPRVVAAAPAPPAAAGAAQSATTQAVRVGHPADWSEVPATRTPIDLRLDDAVQLAPEGMPATDVGLVAGVVRGADPAEPPPGLLGEDGGPPARRAVAIGDVQAYVHEGVGQAGGGERVVVRAMSTPRGAAYATCWAGDVFGDFLPACLEIARTLAPTEDRPLPLGLEPGDREAVGTAIRGLQVIRTAGRDDLARAGTPADQAAVARRLADAHRTAAAAIGADGPRDPGAPLATALRAAGGGYDALARAALAEDPAAFTEARDAVRRAEARAGRELDELRALPTFRGA